MSFSSTDPRQPYGSKGNVWDAMSAQMQIEDSSNFMKMWNIKKIISAMQGLANFLLKGHKASVATLQFAVVISCD